MKTKQLITFCLILISGMMFSQTKAEKKAAKKEREMQKFNILKSLIDSKTYTFEATWALTQGGGRINLMTNPNFMTINNDDAKAELPYFGVVQIMTNYGGDGGIMFEDPLTDYKVTYNEKKRNILVTFKANNKTESFDVTLRASGTENASVNINSTNRNSITYQGNLKLIDNTTQQNTN